jgi:O-antigen/teichoic acid export membrane protein
VPLVLVLVPSLGIVGAALALFINSITQTVVFILIASVRIVGVSVRELFFVALRGPLLALFTTGAIGYALRFLVQDLLSLLLMLLVMPFVHLGAAILMGAITKDDLVYLRRVVGWLPQWFPGRKSLLKWK